MTRRQKIEAALADWFRRETSFRVSEGEAEKWIGGRSVTVDLKRLADDLDQQFENIGAKA